jgi:subtilisin family serine protease/subtilisin-like proprotein convertase family protein
MTDWLRAWPEQGSTNPVELGSRVVLLLESAADLPGLLSGRALQVSRTAAPGLFVLQAPDALTAANEAAALAQFRKVRACYPVMRRRYQLQGPYASIPNDPYFPQQWHLENRDSNGVPAGVDLNIRAAWPYTRGEGVNLGVFDDGVELSHPELAPRAAGQPHFDFYRGIASGDHPSTLTKHGTAVAGLAVAERDNSLGISGVAPRATLTSVVLFNGSDIIADEEQIAQAFQYQSNLIAVQNHSWGNDDASLSGPGLLEQAAISNAVTFGRGGKGVIMVRAAGNYRLKRLNSNDDGYSADPRVITVAAVRYDGRVASYSNPGANLLVAAPSGDPDDQFATLFTTDRQGSALGFNRNTYTNDLADYGFATTGFSGTSGATPLISGLVALMLSTNPNLTSRDVQHALILASRHFDLADPDIVTNAAGFRVSHNVGFGVPDAGDAVRLARTWPNRPPLTWVSFTKTNIQTVPDDGLRVLISGLGVPTNLSNLRARPTTGPHPDDPTPNVPLIDVGLATNALGVDLSGKAALIQRGTNFFRDKIQHAAEAGALFAVIYDRLDGGDVFVMDGTDFVPIPAVLISQPDGEALRGLLQSNLEVRAQLSLDAVRYDFTVPNTLLCEHIGLTLSADHPQRGDLRITLVSPAGTRSILQRLNTDRTSGPIEWTYYSTHLFYESSAGTWTAFVSDENPGQQGAVVTITLTVFGVAITDTDHDGLDDDWELAHAGSLAFGPKDDPDDDGYSNAREQIMGTDPLQPNQPLKLDLSLLTANLARLSWPSSTNSRYEVLAGPNPATLLALLTNLPGRFPETEWIGPVSNHANLFFQLRAILDPQ